MPKRTKSVVGTYFAVPVPGGQFALGQIVEIWMDGVACIAIYDVLVDRIEELIDLVKSDHPLADAISLPSVAKAEIDKGYWPVVGFGQVHQDLSIAPHRKFAENNFIGAEWHSGGIVEKFVSAYHGLIPWDAYEKRPDLLKSLLIGGND